MFPHKVGLQHGRHLRWPTSFNIVEDLAHNWVLSGSLLNSGCSIWLILNTLAAEEYSRVVCFSSGRRDSPSALQCCRVGLNSRS